MAETSYPTPEVRGGSLDKLPHVRGQDSSRDELPHVRGQGQRRRRATPRQRSGPAAERSYHIPEVGVGDREEQPHVQGAAAAQAQEGQEELLHVQGQEGRP